MPGAWDQTADFVGLVGQDREAFQAELDAVDAEEAALVQYMADLAQLPAGEQHPALSDWARSPFWHPALMICTGWQGAVARAAWNALKIELAADTPGRRWNALDPAVGRASIIRLLGLGDAPAAAYAAMPFRTWHDDDGDSLIAGAIGCPALFADSTDIWSHLKVREVILWNPRTDEARIAGEHKSTAAFVLPDAVGDRLTVWGSCGAFFRAWARKRARTGRLFAERAAGRWAHPVVEERDGGLPGGLLVGSYLRAKWPPIDATEVRAGEGITASELHFAAVRSANLPQFRTA